MDFIQDADTEFREIRNMDFDGLAEEDLKTSTLFWAKILSTERADGTLAFLLLHNFIPSILTLPHSSACVKRLFSQYNLNKTKLRNRLSENAKQGIPATKD